MSRQYVRHPPELRRNAVRFLEKGGSLAEASRLSEAPVATVRDWWNKAHPGLPMRKRGAAPLRYVDGCRRVVEVIDWECPHCGGIIHHPVIDTRKPWRCPWCGGDVG